MWDFLAHPYGVHPIEVPIEIPVRVPLDPYVAYPIGALHPLRTPLGSRGKGYEVPIEIPVRVPLWGLKFLPLNPVGARGLKFLPLRGLKFP